jgi:hypothetical protein
LTLATNAHAALSKREHFIDNAIGSAPLTAAFKASKASSDRTHAILF